MGQTRNHCVRPLAHDAISHKSSICFLFVSSILSPPERERCFRPTDSFETRQRHLGKLFRSAERSNTGSPSTGHDAVKHGDRMKNLRKEYVNPGNSDCLNTFVLTIPASHRPKGLGHRFIPKKNERPQRGGKGATTCLALVNHAWIPRTTMGKILVRAVLAVTRGTDFAPRKVAESAVSKVISWRKPV